MLQLVIKDFVLSKRVMLFFFLFVTGFTIAFAWAESRGSFNLVFLYLTAIPVYSFLNRTAIDEEKNNTLRLVDSLPVSRENIVCARYISVFIFSLLNLSVFILVDLCFRLLASGSLDNLLRDSVFELSIMIVLLLINSIYMPILYKIGYRRAAIINMLVIIAVFGGLGAIGEGLTKASANMARWLGSLFAPVSIITAVIAMLVVYLVSMEVAVRLFKRRNLY